MIGEAHPCISPLNVSVLISISGLREQREVRGGSIPQGVRGKTGISCAENFPYFTPCPP